ELLPLIEKQYNQQLSLQKQGFVSDAALTDKQKELVDIRREMTTQAATLSSAQSAVERASAAVKSIKSNYLRELSSQRTSVLAELTQAKGDSKKRQHRRGQLLLTAPVSGSVNGLASLSVGQVITAGQNILSIVPDNEPLRVEGWLRNE